MPSALALALLANAGCALLGWAGDVATGGTRTVKVDAEYERLANSQVAIVVSANSSTQYQFPNAPLFVSQSVARQIAEHIPSAQLVDPYQVQALQQSNPYWNTVSYGQLMDQLGTTRLLLIDLVEYTTRDPEYRHAWRGLISANIGVAEADASNPDSFVYTNTIWARYPSRPVTLLSSDEETIQLGMLKAFAHRTAALFYDHKERRR